MENELWGAGCQRIPGFYCPQNLHELKNILRNKQKLQNNYGLYKTMVTKKSRIPMRLKIVLSEQVWILRIRHLCAPLPHVDERRMDWHLLCKGCWSFDHLQPTSMHNVVWFGKELYISKVLNKEGLRKTCSYIIFYRKKFPLEKTNQRSTKSKTKVGISHSISWFVRCRIYISEILCGRGSPIVTVPLRRKKKCKHRRMW